MTDLARRSRGYNDREMLEELAKRHLIRFDTSAGRWFLVPDPVLAEHTHAALIARSFDALPFAMQQSGGLALAIADAIENATTAENWARSVKWPQGVKLSEGRNAENRLRP